MSEENKAPTAIHIGDGAYISFDGYRYVITANHHLPEEATDAVYIQSQDACHLVNFIKCVTEKFEANDVQ